MWDSTILRTSADEPIRRSVDEKEDSLPSQPRGTRRSAPPAAVAAKSFYPPCRPAAARLSPFPFGSTRTYHLRRASEDES